MQKGKVFKLMVTMALAVILAACGGGGGSGGGGDAANGGAGGGGASTPSAASGTYTPVGNASTVVGVDSQNRGFRDDVAQLISDKYSSDPTVKAAAESAARSYQTSILPSTLSQTDTSSFVQADAQSGGCAVIAAGPAHADAAIAAMQAVYARTFNTAPRMVARQAFLANSKSVGALDFDSGTCSNAGGMK